jgi:Calcineurin-like phosphoesterase
MRSDPAHERPARHGRTLARAFVTVAVSLTVISVLASPAAAYPVVGTAGDIACSPRSSYFNGGFGTSTRCHMRQTASVLSRMSPNRVLPLGDLQYERGEYSNFLRSYDRSWGRFLSVTRPTPGNHEYRTPGASGYFRYFGWRAGPGDRGYYSFNLGRWHIVSLNTNCQEVGGCGPGSRQLRWLADDLRRHRRRACTLAYTHHPRFSSGNEHGNWWELRYLWKMLDDSGAEALLSGHEHDYERFAPLDYRGRRNSRGMIQFVVGTGGRNLRGWGRLQPNTVVRNNRTFGALKLALHDGSLGWRFIPEAGDSFSDRGQRACSKGVP